jgi:hypothetical protein
MEGVGEGLVMKERIIGGFTDGYFKNKKCLCTAWGGGF